MTQTTHDPVERHLAGLLAACRRLGLKATHQRREILSALTRTREHPDVEAVYARVRRRVPAISLDTVYRTLRTLEQGKIIRRVGSQQPRARFDADTDRHHHFVCTQCGRILDCPSVETPLAAVPQAVAALGEVEVVDVEWRGRCAACLKKPKNHSRRKEDPTKRS